MRGTAAGLVYAAGLVVAAGGNGLWVLDALRAGRCFSACGGLDGAGLPDCAASGPAEILAHLGHFAPAQLAAALATAVATAVLLGRLRAFPRDPAPTHLAARSA
jgi:hypothetical protein